MNIKVKEAKCNWCKDNFTKSTGKQIYCSVKCSAEHHKDIRRVKQRKGKHSPENVVKIEPLKKSEYFRKEVLDFMVELKRKCYFLDAVDSYKLLHYYVEIFGVWYFTNMTIEEELSLCLKKCNAYVQKEFKLEKI